MGGESKMKKVKASETLVQTLKNWGIDHVYGLPGDSIDTVVDALRKEQEAIEFIHVDTKKWRH